MHSLIASSCVMLAAMAKHHEVGDVTGMWKLPEHFSFVLPARVRVTLVRPQPVRGLP